MYGPDPDHLGVVLPRTGRCGSVVCFPQMRMVECPTAETEGCQIGAGCAMVVQRNRIGFDHSGVVLRV